MFPCYETCNFSRYQTDTVKRMLDTILSIQPKDSSQSGGETREAIVYRLSDEILNKLPNDYVAHEVLLFIIIILLKFYSD